MTYQCEEMMCGHCVSRIDSALAEAGITHQVDLDTKTVTIDGEEDICKKAEEILDDLGFTPIAV